MVSKPPLIYLDTCCLNRPLDDASQERIRLEAEAVRMILRLVELRQLSWVTSEVLRFEVDLTPNMDRRKRVLSTMKRADLEVRLEDSIIQEAEKFEKMGLASLDALHVASAKAGKARVFLTVDDALLRKAKKVQNKIGIKVENPLSWIGDLE
jgi:predicted nucleic acid-binding protein